MNKTLFNKIDSTRLLACAFAVSMVVQLVLGFAFPNYMDNAAQFYIVQGVYGISLGLVAVIYSKAKSVDIRSAMRFNRKPSLLHTGILLAILLVLINAMTPINQWFIDFLESVGFGQQGVAIKQEFVYQYWPFAILVICIIPAFCEEIVFRGVIGNGYVNSYKPLPAILLSGVLFALFHTNPAQTLHQFVLGCILTLFVMRSGSLWVAIIGHFFNNSMALLLGATVEPTGFYQDNALWLAIVGIAVVAIALVLYCKFVPSNTALSNDDRQTKVNLSIMDKAIFFITILLLIALWVAVLVIS